MTLDDLLRLAVQAGASDLLVRAGSPPLVRLHGQWEPLGGKSLSAAEAEALSLADLDTEQRARFDAERELTFAYAAPDGGRFRVHLYRQRGQTQSVFHAVPSPIRSLEDLRLPPVCKYFAERPSGLVLVSGLAGSGRSTTLAAMVDYINRHFSLAVLTLEDPIEHIHQDREAVVNQRELDRDTPSLASALRAALRQDMDVVLVGDLHDAELRGLALTAAETGHLVLAALHGADAVQTLDHFIEAFPQHQQQPARMQLSANLIGVVCQSLVRTQDGRGRVAAFETLVGVPPVQALIREGKTHQISPLLQTGGKQGMMALDQSLAQLVKKGTVTYESALAHARSRAEFDFLCNDETMPAVEAKPASPSPPAKPTLRLNPPS